MQQQKKCGERAGKVKNELHDVGPDHGLHAALEGVDQHESHDQQDGSALPGAQRRRDDQRDGRDAHAFGENAGHQKRGRRDRLYFCAKPPFHQLVGRIIFSAEVVGKK